MKRLLLFPLLLCLFSISFSQENSEVSKYPTNYWILGINAGAAYQSSDVCTKHPGFGWGVTLGKNYLTKVEKPFWFGFRGRYLNARTIGADNKLKSNISNNPEIVNLGYAPDSGVYANHRTVFNKVGIEGIIGSNPLYHKYNTLLYLFGGVGVDFYQAKYDHLDIAGNTYDYQNIYETVEVTGGDVVSALDLFRDQNYETNAQGNSSTQVRFTPHIGIGLGYQFGDYFGMSLEHMTTFALTTNIDGQLWNADNTRAKNDYWHYTGVKMHFTLVPPNERTPKPLPTPPPTQTPDPGQILPPEITITQPGSNPAVVDFKNVTITAQITNVSGKNDIVFSINGMAFRSFTFNPTNGNFSANINLNPGTNELVIAAENEAGKDIAVQIIQFITDEEPVEPMPEVDITFPTENPYSVGVNSVSMTASIKNVESRSGVKVLVNGYSTDAFTFDPNTDQFAINILLQTGNNNITIIGTNSVGSDQGVAIIKYDEVVPTGPPPVITIYQPKTDPITVNSPIANVEALIENISDRNQIAVTFNGSSYSGYSFDPISRVFKATVNLQQGVNIMVITARNDAGSDSESQTINLVSLNDPPPSGNPPVISIVTPQSSPATVNTPGIAINATISNINSANQLVVTAQGIPTNAFNFNSSTNYFNLSANLNEGANTFTILATNSYGTDQKTVVINYAVPVVPPVVSITSPSSAGQTFATPSQSVLASVKNIRDRSGINIKFNGNTLSTFTFDPVSGNLILPVTLQLGTNSVEITAQNSAGTDSETTSLIHYVPVNPPLVDITVPTTDPYSTFQSTATVFAYVRNVSKKSDISVLINEQSFTGFSFNSSTGELSLPVSLDPGTNSITISARNETGNASDNVRIIYTEAVSPPVVSFTQPSASGQSFVNSVQTIQADVSNVLGSSQIQVTFNGDPVTTFSFNPSSRLLTYTVSLQEGNNTTSVSATNSGGSDSKSTNLILQAAEPVPSLPKPTVSINQPASNPFNTNQSDLTIKSVVKNVSRSSDVQVTFNGQPITNFVFSALNGQVLFQASLKSGQNIFQISASNESGSASASTVINYSMPVEPPFVKITNPDESPVNTTSPNSTITAQVINVEESKDIQITHNGSKLSNFSFDASRDELDFSVLLQPGNNTIIISASNSSGNASDQTVIIYSPILKPDVTILDPSSSPKSSPRPSYQVSAQILNVNSREEISVTLNGQAITSYSFDPGSGSISFPANLSDGENLVIVSASNEAGNDSEQRVITYSSPKPPTVNIITPRNGDVIPQPTTNVEATVTNVAQANQISVKVNGSSISNFQFDPVSSIVTFTANLSNGSNSINVAVSNEFGSDSKSVSVTYNAPQPPTVVITTPNQPSVTITQGNYEMRAQVTNVSKESDITVTINGSNYNNINYNPTSGLLLVFLDLDPGSANVVITVRNDAGSDTDNATVTREIPNPAKVNIVSPANGATVTQNSVAVEAGLNNVTQANQVTAKVNGSTINNVNFNPSNGKVTFTASLNAGVNTITVSADNGFGSESKTVNVTYSVPSPPSITLISPNSANTTSPQPVAEGVQFQLNGVDNRNQITVQVNGAPDNSYTFDSASKILRMDIPLMPGANTISVSATNSFGSDSQTITINHQ